MKQKGSRVLLLISAFLPIVIVCIGVRFLPDTIPIHYNAQNEIDNYGDKSTEYIMAGMFTAIGLFMMLVSWCTEKFFDNGIGAEEKAKKNAVVINWIGSAMMLFLSIIQATELIHIYWEVNDIGHFPELKIVSMACMIFMFLLGIFIKKAEKNPLMGVRVSWSMESEEAWKVSQESAGKGTMYASIVCLVISFVLKEKYQVLVIILGLLAITAVMLITSYLATKRLSDKK